MKPEMYRDLYNRLCEYEDIKKIHRETGIDEELLLVIFTQRVSRDVTRNYYKVKAYTGKMVQDWNKKSTFAQIARRWRFSPILTAYFIMLERGVPRKKFWSYVREPQTAPDERLRREFAEIGEIDMVYSPKGMEIQYARGRWGEAKLGQWLHWKGLGHRTEKDLKGKTAKTPDCLLDKPLEWEGVKIDWIESKAIFGDDLEFRRHWKKQLKPYTEMFGNGIVVYWFGFTDNLVPPDGIFIVDGRFFEIPEGQYSDTVPGLRDIPPCCDGTIVRPTSLVGPGYVKLPPRQEPLVHTATPVAVPGRQMLPAREINPPQQQRQYPQSKGQQSQQGMQSGGGQGRRRHRRRGRRGKGGGHMHQQGHQDGSGNEMKQPPRQDRQRRHRLYFEPDGK